ncbi:beta-N-acetylhexosaminidase [soil metagenome]
MRVVFVLLTAVVAAAACSPRSAPRVAPTPAVESRVQLLPLPRQIERRSGGFALTPAMTIHASEAFMPIANALASWIGMGIGPEPPTVERLRDGNAPAQAIVFRQAQGTSELGAEGYALEVTSAGITISAATPAGAFYGMQTLRQLLPGAWEYEALRPPAKNAPSVVVPALMIRDQPRFEWRGAMLDVARHFFTVDDVKRYIDLMALHKLNRLHLHLADDQGWRIDIRSWPNLAIHGGSTEVGGGPGGFYGQDQYAAIVRYAAERFITIVPEIDMPGHTNAALASYAELNCDRIAPPLYTGIEVGFSALCVEKEETYKFIDDVVREIAALTPGPYFHIGGDEVKKLTQAQYNAFIERVQGIVQSHGKQMIGWDEIAPTQLAPSSIVQHWRPDASIAELAGKGVKVVMSVADRMYLDMKYHPDTPIGLAWAGTVDVRKSYDWDPAAAASGLPESSLLGVEAPLWSETVTNIRDVEFLAFPRLAAIAEMGWSAQSDRHWDDFRVRLGAQTPRWTALGLNFYRAAAIPWK